MIPVAHLMGTTARLAAAGDVLRTMAEPAASATVNALWQGTLIACGLALALRLAPRMAAAHRFAAWAAGFALIAGLPLLGVAAGFTAAGAASGEAAHGIAVQPWLNLDARWSLAIAAVWAAVTLLRLVELAVHSAKVRRLWKQARPVEVDGALRAVVAARTASWMRGRAEVCTVEGLERPCVIGFFRPRILIPAWLLAKMTPGELEQIVLHEAEHLRRGDDWTNLLQKVGLAVFPLNPALAWVERRLCREREMACDDGVVEVTRAPRAYAACLASLAERRLERSLNRRAEALALGAWQRRPELVERVHSILRRKTGLSAVAGRMVLGAIGCGLVAGAVELARCPQLVGFVEARPVETASVEAVQADGVVKAVAPERAAKRVSKPVSAKAEPASELAALDLNRTLSGASRDEQRAVALSAETVPAQQWMVLTAYEEIEPVTITTARTQAKADYDVAPDAPASAPQNEPARHAAAKTTVTRLVLRIVQTDANSNTGQPGMMTMPGGWLVIQL